MATIDIHRLLDAWLPEGKKCESVTVVEVYTATVDGEAIACQVELDAVGKDETIAQYVVSQVSPATDNAAMEGEEVEEPPPEEEHEDHPEHRRSSKHKKK
jgi:hypothetical protein